MFSDVMSYSSLSAKLHAMGRNLFRDEHYMAMSELKKVSDIYRQLADNAAYQNAFSQLDDKETNRQTLERVMHLSLLESNDKLYHFITKKTDKDLMDFYFTRHEIAILKSIMRVVYDKANHANDMSIFSYMNERMLNKFAVDFSKAQNIKSMKEFMDMLTGTKYFAVLEQAVVHEATLFELETRLDIFYYLNLWKTIKKTNPKDEAIQAIFGTQIDLFNIFALYRIKRFYHINPSELYSTMIPVQFKIKKSAIYEMIEAKNLQEFMDILSKSHYGFLVTMIETKGIENTEFAVMEKVYDTYAKRSQFSLALLFEYLFKKEYEMQNVTILIEGVGYGKNPEDIRKLLYRTKEMAV